MVSTATRGKNIKSRLDQELKNPRIFCSILSSIQTPVYYTNAAVLVLAADV